MLTLSSHELLGALHTETDRELAGKSQCVVQVLTQKAPATIEVDDRRNRRLTHTSIDTHTDTTRLQSFGRSTVEESREIYQNGFEGCVSTMTLLYRRAQFVSSQTVVQL